MAHTFFNSSERGTDMASNTKEALAAAMKKLLATKPVDKITVKDLVEECGVNRQTFYYHFDDVYDLLEWVFEQDADRVPPAFTVIVPPPDVKLLSVHAPANAADVAAPPSHAQRDHQ